MKYLVNREYGGYCLYPEIVEEYYTRKNIAFDKSYDPAFKVFVVFPLKNGEPDETFWAEKEIRRNDPDLIAVIEKLGTNTSEGIRYKSLVAVEVPDDVEVELIEYDGFEHLAEKHRTWP